MKRIVGAAFAVTAVTAIVLTLKIYFGYSGSGQMYSPEKVSGSLKILLIPLLISVICAVVTAVLDAKNSKKEPLPPRMKFSEKVPKIAAAAGILAALYILVYLCTVSHFESRDLEYTAGHLVMNVLPAAAVLLVSAYFMQKDVSPKPPVRNEKRITAVRIAVLAAALVLIAAGIFNGGMRDVLVKAINICTECIGLG